MIIAMDVLNKIQEPLEIPNREFIEIRECLVERRGCRLFFFVLLVFVFVVLGLAGDDGDRHQERKEQAHPQQTDHGPAKGPEKMVAPDSLVSSKK